MVNMMKKQHIEELAIKLAEANNGGKWATHYEEAQKDVWRKRARTWAREVINLYELEKFDSNKDPYGSATQRPRG